ncbi:hypothetical protein [Mycolicibacterium sphagni]|uniref:hypothetical protein n=1 Tax=Mycolicibacterium sphagni TaxID=1786 RepID=UPI0021F25F85|nr:hypothetical protein [Mycolicibacterium sphagni]MCV7174754.1 hypothetical protein [Mycolicibacterium sphagni]
MSDIGLPLDKLAAFDQERAGFVANLDGAIERARKTLADHNGNTDAVFLALVRSIMGTNDTRDRRIRFAALLSEALIRLAEQPASVSGSPMVADLEAWLQ